MNQEDWEQKSREILTDIREWRQAHPKATFVEIEAEVHRRMVELEAQLVEDAVQESESRAWGKGSEPRAPECPNCHEPLQPRGEKTRSLQGNGGQTIKIKRTHGTCPKCGQSFFPSG